MRKQISFRLDGLRNLNGIKAFVRLNNLRPKDYVFASLGHIYDFTDLSIMKLKLVENSNKKVLENALIQNYPNPFNPTTQIEYTLPADMQVTLKVYDILGREVAVLVDDWKEAGRYEIEWNGEKHSSGVYLYKLSAGEFVAVKKMLLAK